MVGLVAPLLMIGSCGATVSVEDYLNDLSAVTVQMTRDAFEALPPGAAPTHEQVTAVIAARRKALDAIKSLAPPSDLEAEHLVLIAVFEDFVAAGESFLDETSTLPPDAFREALDSSSEIDLLADRVTSACDAVRLRAEVLGLIVSLAC